MSQKPSLGLELSLFNPVFINKTKILYVSLSEISTYFCILLNHLIMPVSFVFDNFISNDIVWSTIIFQNLAVKNTNSLTIGGLFLGPGCLTLKFRPYIYFWLRWIYSDPGIFPKMFWGLSLDIKGLDGPLLTSFQLIKIRNIILSTSRQKVKQFVVRWHIFCGNVIFTQITYIIIQISVNLTCSLVRNWSISQ